MNWENLLSKSAYWSKWLLLGYCVSHTYFNLSSLPAASIALVTGTTTLLVADWVNTQRK